MIMNDRVPPLKDEAGPRTAALPGCRQVGRVTRRTATMSAWRGGAARALHLCWVVRFRGGGGLGVVGVIVLVVVLVAAIALALVGTGRRAAAAARLRRAEARIQAALQGGGGGEAITARLADVAMAVSVMGAAEAAALVLASRRAFSRDIIPVLVAALGHRSGTVTEDAASALADLGSPGLRAVWQALEATEPAPAGLQAFLARHPDWLFQRLVEAYASGGESAVRRHASLWRQDGMVSRLALLRSGSDAINALRASAITGILGEGGTRVA